MKIELKNIKFMFNLVKNIKMSEQISPNQEIKKTHPIKSFFKKVLFFFSTLFFITVLGAIFYFNSTAEKGFSAGVLVNFSEKGFLLSYINFFLGLHRNCISVIILAFLILSSNAVP